MFKKLCSLLLVAITIFSVASFGLTSASAAAISGNMDIYHFKFYTGDAKGAETSKGITVTALASSVPDIPYDFNFSSTFRDCGIKAGLTENALRHYELGKYLTGFEFTLNDKNDPWFLERVEVTLENQNITYNFSVYEWVTDSITLYKSDVNDNVYKFTVKTSNDSNAGTDAKIFFTVQAKNTHRCVTTSNAIEGKSCFNKGDEYVFYANLRHDTFESLEIDTGYDRTNAKTELTSLIAADWKVESVKVEKINGENKEKESMNVTVNQWIDYSTGFFKESHEDLIIGKNSTPTNAYKVEVKTSNKSFAGTDADIEFQLVCEHKSSLYCDIDRFANEYSGSINNYEKGNLDKFQMVFTNDGDNHGRFDNIKGLNIKNTGGGAGPDWHVDYIKLTEIVPEGTTAKTYTFKINDWIDKGETYCCTNFTVE